MKYYITIDQYRGIFHAGNPYQACMKALKRKFVDNRIKTDALGRHFRVSQRGFLYRHDDELIPTDTILNLMMMVNNASSDDEF